MPLAARMTTATVDNEIALEHGPDISEQRTLPVAVAVHGQRLDKALTGLVPELSRSYLQQLLEQGLVTINGQISNKPAHKVKVGDVIVITIRPTQQSQAFTPERLQLDVVYEDEHLLVIHKPVGLVVHPAPGHWRGTLMNGLLGRYPSSIHIPRAGIVHRLDKDTSGLMVVARSRPVMDALVSMIAARQVSRQYLALAWGAWQGAAQRHVQSPIGRDPHNRLRMAVVDTLIYPGKAAHTEIDLLENSSHMCLVRCTLHTGRTHQIRLHMASINHPLVSDGLYGGKPGAGLVRQALHAFRLAFIHPISGAAMAFEAPLPTDMEQALETVAIKNPLKQSGL